MSAYPVEHVPTRKAVLTRLAQLVRARLEVTETEMDRIGISLDVPGESEINRNTYTMYSALTARFDALTEVLGLIEKERRGQ